MQRPVEIDRPQPVADSGSGSISEGGKSEPSGDAAEETKTSQTGWRDVVRFDVPASIVVFLVAVPLSLGIALASGAPVYSGLISAVVGGILGGLLGGSALMVSGPAAGMVVVAAGLITQFGWPVMCAITVCAGILQIIFGVSRLARVALGISPAIVHGMLAGIGVTIVLGQLHVLLGFKAASSPLENVRALPADIVAEHPWATAVGALTFAILLVWPKLPAAVRKVPGPLVAVVVVTVLATVADLPVDRVDIPGNLLTQLSFAPRLPEAGFGAFAVGVITVALIASVENLLSAVAVDKMHKGPRAKLSRELVGQGITNMACGSVGGLPVTGVIVRSSTNVMAGARTRWSAIVHGVWVLVFTVLLGGLIQNIPMASLAGLLVYVGIKLVNLGHIRTAARHRDIAIYVATLGGVVLLDLMKGVFLGLVVAVFLMMRRMMWSGIHADKQDDGWHVVLKGTLSFLSTPRLSMILNKIPQGQVVHLDVIADYLDHSAVETITDWQSSYEDAGGTVIVHEIGHPWLRTGQTGEPTIHRKAAAESTPRWMASSSDGQSPESERLATDGNGDITVNPALHR
ncbi:MAG: SulP family inorganic anion transporter, partial [Actinomycetota bacterium]|nr:SulP family inorganic anion transporter [Actinomycetota bacterium]